EVAEQAPDAKVFDRVAAMLLGELNASHLGYRSFVKPFQADNSHEITAHLGVKFDSNFKGPGLKVRQVIDGTNAEKEDSRLFVGDIILEIDGKACDIDKDLTLYLNGRLKRDIFLKVKSKEEIKDIKIRPHSYSEVRKLLYDRQVEIRKSKVRDAGNGKMGYLHVSSMLWPEFNKFKEEVFKEGNGRDGLVIDVRNNGGGFTADHLISVLTQPRHAITVPRNGSPGYPFSRQVYLNWYKPIVVLCNQYSYSNAEIFTHAIKSLNRGKIIGVSTAGGVISTGAKGILGKGTLRIPFRGWYVSGTGEDMEMNGAEPDITIWPLPGELENGKDVQLEKAIEVLNQEIMVFKDLNDVKLKKASER
ncbi:MAG: S41 family peptidase, partial [Lentisphaeraceae bacterium]|nr:S41 family peptidase [Lentisphaeraceae bacterium]